MAAALGLVLVAGGCRSDDEAVARWRGELSAVLAALALRPFGTQRVTPSEVRSKGGPPYLVATGILDLPREAALARVRAVLDAQGWVRDADGPVRHFLGWELRATKGTEVMLVSLGPGAIDVPASPYRPLEGGSYVQIAVAGRDSTPAWSHVGPSRGGA